MVNKKIIIHKLELFEKIDQFLTINIVDHLEIKTKNNNIFSICRLLIEKIQ